MEREAENSGVQIPAKIRWLGGARSEPVSRKRKRGPLRWWPQLWGRQHSTAFADTGFDSSESNMMSTPTRRCDQTHSVHVAVGGHIAPDCTSTDPKCSICSGDHEAINHRCPVEGCKVGKGHPCPHGAVKCANCGGPHGARADVCAAKREARMEARGGGCHPQSGGRRARGLRNPKNEPRPPRGERRVRWRLLCRRRKGPLRWPWRWRSRRRTTLFSPFFSFLFYYDFVIFSFVRRVMGGRNTRIPHYNSAFPWRSSGPLSCFLFVSRLLCLGVKVLFSFFLLFALFCFLAGLGRRRRCETLTMTAQAGPRVGKGYTGGKGRCFPCLRGAAACCRCHSPTDCM